MVPYRATRTRTRLIMIISACDSSTSTTVGPREDNQTDRLLLTLTRIPREEDLSVLLKEKPRFARVMKTRNTDGRPIKYSTWKPVQMYNGRDNIGTRNFKKFN